MNKQDRQEKEREIEREREIHFLPALSPPVASVTHGESPMLYRNRVLLASPAPWARIGEGGRRTKSVGRSFPSRAGVGRAGSVAEGQAPRSAGVAGLPISTFQFCGKFQFQGLRSLCCCVPRATAFLLRFSM